MFNSIKNFIKTKPKIYDMLNAIRPIKSEAEVWLDRFSKLNDRTVKFIQVGASDGLRWDPVRRFILRDNWSGVLIEPIYPVYRMLINNYSYAKRKNLFFENCAISNEDCDSIDFWLCSDDFLNSLTFEKRLYYLRKSSLDRKHVERFLREVGGADQKIECYKTRCMTLNAIIEKYFLDNKVDLIFIDAEGHDDYVIRTINFEKCMPKAIFYESHNLGSRNNVIKHYLSLQGYTIAQLGGDAVAAIEF